MLKISKSGLQSAAGRLSSQLLMILLLLGVVAFVGVFIWQSVRIKEMQTEYEQKKVALSAIQERNDRLQEHLDFYNSPGYMLYVEKVAREALGLARPGETVVLPVADKNVAVSPSSPAVKAETELATPGTNTGVAVKPSWQNWFSFFFG